MLAKFIKNLEIEHTTERLYERRVAAAHVISEKYGIKPPGVVMVFTIPEYQNMTIQDRCSAVGISEEELFLCFNNAGFKEFLEDYKVMLRHNLDIQSLDKLSKAVKTTREVPGQYGSHEDLSIESKILDKAPEIVVNNNTQNNFYEDARKRSIEIRAREENQRD